MSKPKFVYVTFIRATPEKVWEALTKADLTEKYWFGYRVSAEGKPGDTMTPFWKAIHLDVSCTAGSHSTRICRTSHHRASPSNLSRSNGRHG
jgi:Activator of Hsp90 ATPase homolog 1-like protein